MGRVAWLLRWLMVLLLVTDLVGSPLHRHQHNFGFGGASLHGPLANSLHGARHLEDDIHGPDFVHAVTTIRAQSRVLVADMSTGTDSQDVALLPAWPLPGSHTPAIHVRYQAEPDTALHPLHRSLPPAGRAPPLRA